MSSSLSVKSKQLDVTSRIIWRRFFSPQKQREEKMSGHHKSDEFPPQKFWEIKYTKAIPSL